jgi:hypothetical protein
MPVSVAGGAWPVWGADGHELDYRAQDGRLMAVSVAAGRDFKAGLPVPLFFLKVNTGGLGPAPSTMSPPTAASSSTPLSNDRFHPPR